MRIFDKNVRPCTDHVFLRFSYLFSSVFLGIPWTILKKFGPWPKSDMFLSNAQGVCSLYLLDSIQFDPTRYVVVYKSFVLKQYMFSRAK